MGVSDRVALRMKLTDVYVPLKARIELPEGETWARKLKLAGRQVSPEEAESMGARLSDPQSVLKLLAENDGLIILGDPGAGKTTFIKYLTLKLARGEGEEIGLGDRLPVLMPLSAYAHALVSGDVPIDQFIETYYCNRGVNLPMCRMLLDAMKQGRALIMLDGLDEVQSLPARHKVVDRVVKFFAFHKAKGNRFVLTSRIVGYRDARPESPGLTECTLVDFEKDDILQFVSQWTLAIEKAARDSARVFEPEAAREQTELLEAIERNPGVLQLASNPLLLTILVLMKRQGISLPERRVELYEQYVKTLLKNWNLARGLDRSYQKDLDVIETVRILAPLALWMHENSPGVGLMKREAVRRKIEEIYVSRGEPNPERATTHLLKDVHDYTALLLERGSGTYGFIHLTFQEYLAAQAVALQGQRSIDPIVEKLLHHLEDPTWNEITQLSVAFIGIIQQSDQKAGDVLTGMLDKAKNKPAAAILSGRAVTDAFPGGITIECRDKVIQALLDTMREKIPADPKTRAEAGNVLAEIGDPRQDVMTLDQMEFCLVPGGDFWMGEAGGTDNKRHLNTKLQQPYWIGKYPITNAQYHPFVKNGYPNQKYWVGCEKTGVEWKDGRVKPTWDENWRDKPYDYGYIVSLPNHPVIGITWFETLAFTLWLTDEWQKNGGIPKTWSVRLASEAEWEKAARGGIEIPEQEIVLPFHQIIQKDVINNIEKKKNDQSERFYPWGDEPDANYANIKDSQIGATNAVGCFVHGKSPYGCEEMSGNVWEWTRSIDKPYPYEPDDGREDVRNVKGSSRMRLRGGSFYIDEKNQYGCGGRVWCDPIFHYKNNGFRVVFSPFSYSEL